MSWSTHKCKHLHTGNASTSCTCPPSWDPMSSGCSGVTRQAASCRFMNAAADRVDINLSSKAVQLFL